ncbi:MAG: M56 family metallopeptidase [Actinomycetota bacterium]
MRLDTPNRAFVVLVGGAIVVLIAMALVACGVLGIVVHGLFVGTTTLTGLLSAALFALLVVAGGVAGLRSLRSQLRATRDLARRVGAITLPLPTQVAEASRRLGLVGRVVVVDAAEPFSFAYGLTRPSVVVSSGLADAPVAELDAVLSHERYHVQNLDPLKVLLTRTLSATLFYFPVLRRFHHRYMTGRELAADRRAIEAHGRTPLAGALYRVVAGPHWPELRAAAAMGDPDLLEARVAQLETGREPDMSRAGWPAITVTVLAAAALLSASIAAMSEMSRLMPTMMMQDVMEVNR